MRPTPPHLIRQQWGERIMGKIFIFNESLMVGGVEWRRWFSNWGAVISN